MKIKFICNKCHEGFNVDAKYFKNKADIVCPNCGNVFPPSAFQDLKIIVTKIDRIKESLHETNKVGADTSTWTVDFLKSTNEPY